MYKNVNVIFHHPLPLDENAKSASGIRPLRMLGAFRDLGCSVDLVTGYSVERKYGIKKIKENIRNGKKYDFVYSESSTMPTVLTESHHLPLSPIFDWQFFLFCKVNNIPIGLFYRDIYWKFDGYGENLNLIKSAVAKIAYRFDLWVYQRTLSKLYLPSIEMGEYIPEVCSSIFSALPPGHTLPDVDSLYISDFSKKTLKLFYVGGMSEHYQMHKLFAAVSELSTVELTICTREAEWQAVKEEYPTLTNNIHIVHLSGVDMENELRKADIALLFVKPYEYREFASPVKLYEYLGFQKPVIASDGTLAGKFIKEHGIGWTVPYDIIAIKDLLTRLSTDVAAYETVIKNIRRIAPQHSWLSRAEQVIQDFVQ